MIEYIKLTLLSGGDYYFTNVNIMLGCIKLMLKDRPISLKALKVYDGAEVIGTIEPIYVFTEVDHI